MNTFIIILDVAYYAVTEANRWGILTKGLLYVYKQIIITINVSLDELLFVKMVMKLHGSSLENIGGPKVSLEKQRQRGSSGSALNTTEKGGPK